MFQMLKKKNNSDVFVENQIETYYESGDEKPPYHNDDGQPKYLQQTLNSIYVFLMSLVT